MPNFNISIKKGDIGEQIVQEYLENKGYIVYKISKKNGPHRFDFFVDHLKKECFALDVKTKSRLNKWARQGINVKDYFNYRKFAEDQNVPFFVYFVDDKNGDVHCADIMNIKDAMYLCDGTIITWPLENMTHLFILTDEQIKELTKYDQRGHDYAPTLF